MSVWLQGYTQSAYYSKHGLAKAEEEIEPAAFTIHLADSRNIHTCLYISILYYFLLLNSSNNKI